MKLDVTPQYFRDICIIKKGLKHQHVDYGDMYLVFATDGGVIYCTEISQSDDATIYNIYKNNYSGTANERVDS